LLAISGALRATDRGYGGGGSPSAGDHKEPAMAGPDSIPAGFRRHRQEFAVSRVRRCYI